jgi:hypothetical protein
MFVTVVFRPAGPFWKVALDLEFSPAIVRNYPFPCNFFAVKMAKIHYSVRVPILLDKIDFVNFGSGVGVGTV